MRPRNIAAFVLILLSFGVLVPGLTKESAFSHARTRSEGAIASYRG